MVGVYFQINDWVLSVDENKLYRQDREVTVEPRLINLLHFLAEHANEVFNREELIQYVWAGAIVTDQVVTQSIFELRKLLRDGREENTNYVITVPKRGYKLVANVVTMTHEEFVTSRQNEEIPPSVEESEEDCLPIAPAVTFPAGPLTRAVCEMSKEKKAPQSKNKISHWRLGIMNFIWISMLVVVMGVFTYKQSEVRITQAIDTHLIEFKFQDNFTNEGLSYDLADGFAQKLMSDIAQVSDYRVMLKKASFTSGIVPGKSVVVRVRENDGGSFLEVEYCNNSSEKVLFSRQYALTSSHLKTVLQQASLDLMQVLKVSDAKLKSTMLVAGMPMNPDALELFVQANHYLNVSDTKQFRQGIDLMENILEIEPDNAYVQAELLIAYHVQKALDFSQELKKGRMQQLSEALETNVKMMVGPIQPRIYEALALHETIIGDMALAKRHLGQALRLRDSVLSYVIRGKHAELDGDLDLASESYSEAFYIDTSVETYLLCENLVFPSNMKAIDYAMYRAVHPSVVRML
ncbi:lysine decarboxylation/transport transcriptional activator CadC [Vibrio alginolyticus]|uniref:lysine decarboxylation/transport transcriptional activator CadC n=1 Tax=Vibrio alginolyticus TaxID=663 RepID=UPI001ED31414|nr:lysine decarboxylation/transport transcriptional activator CadC [Vibrio alginolyticus]EGR0723165.1 transcriptional regulator CadC [Vibrio alginolyticus]EIO9265451.1 lysine decarboxylation/transport transcriptional activator CadC [Vibrio alginolyticus]ELA7328435.1 lysine decarboxylation/transport transcriptional activator CadC [Vibrio alginolyticus]ELB1642088.1 lysine decarboxylation/transport transcriptional activator CadC [Vibrio alginolyticus]ELB2876124.1 lysine decarboxylation/transport 